MEIVLVVVVVAFNQRAYLVLLHAYLVISVFEMLKKLISLRTRDCFILIGVVLASANIAWSSSGLFNFLNFEPLLNHMNSTFSTIVVNLVLLIRIFSIKHLILGLLVVIVSTHNILILF